VQGKIIESIVHVLWDAPLIFAILLTGFYYTAENKFFHIRYPRHIFHMILKNIKGKKDSNSKGMLFSFEAASIAIGSTVGIGSIGGVATAIAVGGPGAVFWMWVAAFVGMMIKMAEITLAVYYRDTDEEGNVYGGPIQYIEKGIGEEMKFKWWAFPAVVFGICLISTIFISIQNYIASDAISLTFGQNIFAVSFTYSILVFFMTRCGITYLGKISKIIVPIMTLAYIVLGLTIIFMNFERIIPSFEYIVRNAFLGTAAIGGFAGATLSQAITMGVSQAVYSSEFGWGTSPLIHSTAKVDHPVKQGLWGGVEVFFTSIIICSITAFVIILSGKWTLGGSGIDLALQSFESTLGIGGRYMITIILFFFALTTSTGWYSYSEIIVRNLLKKKPILKNTLLKYLKVFYSFPEFIFVVYVTAFHLPDKIVWFMTYITVAIPTFINIFALLILSHKFKKILLDYKMRNFKIGEMDEEDLFYEKKRGGT
jgi:AGCS family alanine or glycine:cation symporter